MHKNILPIFCIVVYAIVASIGAFSGGLWAAFAIGLAAVLFLSLVAAGEKGLLPPRHFACFTLAALAVFAAELPFSSQPDVSFRMWAQLLTIFVPLLLLTSRRLQAAAFSPAFVPVAALAMFVGAMGLGLELQSGGAFLHMLKKTNTSLTEYNRGAAHLVILAFPVIAMLWLSGGKRMACALGLMLLFPASLTESHTAQLALIVGAACAVAAFYKPLWVRRALAAGSAVIMLWPFYARWVFAADYDGVEHWHSSWRHRMEIWDYLSYRIGERPVLGWGLGTTHLLDFSQPHGNLYAAVTEAAPHAHNFVTQLWAETGLVGLALGLVFLLWTLRRAYALHPLLRPFALGGWAAAVTVSMFGFDFWTDALWAAFALSAFAFGMIEQNIEGGDDAPGAETA